MQYSEAERKVVEVGDINGHISSLTLHTGDWSLHSDVMTLKKKLFLN